MNDVVFPILAILAAYLIGAIPFGYLIARAKGINLFEHGSGNIGATNVGRVVGKKFGFLVFALDFAKGAFPTLLAQFVSTNEIVLMVAGLAAILGHMFSPYLGFRGGKGVATGAGVVLVLLPIPMLVSLVVWIGVVAMTRIISAASLAAALALIVTQLITAFPPFSTDHVVLSVFSLVVAGLVFIRHRSNIQRLLQGKENQLKEGATMQSLLKIVHVMAMGMWFGTVMFFTLVAFSLFGTFEEMAVGERPSWFAQGEWYEQGRSDILEADKEQGTRAAGFAISPIFDWYFLIQGFCGFLAVATAFGCTLKSRKRTIDNLRILVLVLALLTVVGGWPLERYVSGLRGPRNHSTEAHLNDPSDETLKTKAVAARKAFGMWHGISMMINLGTIVLVTVGMGMAGLLPTSIPTSDNESPDRNSSEK